MNTITYSDEMRSRRRQPWLLLIKEDEITPFAGDSIPGIAVVAGTDYRKNGKWSHTTFRLQLAPGVRAISGMDGWETGRFTEGLGRAVGVKTPDTWAETAQALGVSVPAAMKFLRSWRSKAANALDETEELLATLDDQAIDAADEPVVVTVSFGNPSNRQMRAGWWREPKLIYPYAAELRLKNPEKGWGEDNIEIIGMSGKILSVQYSAGMHGGYYAVSVAVVPGTEAVATPQPSASAIKPDDTVFNPAFADALQAARLRSSK